MTLLGDVEREVGTHHTKADQADVGVSHGASLDFCLLDLVVADAAQQGWR